jgi:hypothetical protein
MTHQLFQSGRCNKLKRDNIPTNLSPHLSNGASISSTAALKERLLNGEIGAKLGARMKQHVRRER